MSRSSRSGSRRLLAMFVGLLSLLLFPGRTTAREDRDLLRSRSFRVLVRRAELPFGEEAYPGPFARDPTPPAWLGEPLEPRFVRDGAEFTEASRREWRRRLRAHGGHANLAPLSALDPSRELLVLIPGIGMNLQDMHVLRWLEDSYQVLIVITDQTRPLLGVGRQVAATLAGFMHYWQNLARARGERPSRRLRVVGHSFGGAIGYLAVVELSRQGLLQGGEDAAFERILFVGMDAPWRGVDLPWMATLPGIKQLGAVLTPLLPLRRRLTRGRLSILNRTRSMNRLARSPRSARVVTRLATVVEPPPVSRRVRRLDPLSNWYTQELGKRELKRLRRFYRDGGGNLKKLDYWFLPGIIKRRGLRNLVFFLSQDEDYARVHPALVTAAREAPDLASFGRRWDALVGSIVDTFEGEHTGFMDEDPRFMPWIRRALADF